MAQWPLIDSPKSARIRFSVSLTATARQETFDVLGFLVPESNPMNVRIPQMYSRNAVLTFAPDAMSRESKE